MDERTAGMIKATRAEVEASALEPEHKDVLQGMLDHAHKCANGTPDKVGAIGEAVAALIVRDARKEVRDHKRLKDEIAAHMAVCGKRTAPKNVREFAQRMAADYPLVVMIAAMLAIKGIGFRGDPVSTFDIVLGIYILVTLAVNIKLLSILFGVYLAFKGLYSFF